MKILDSIQHEPMRRERPVRKAPAKTKVSEQAVPTDPRIVIHDKPDSDLSRSQILKRLDDFKTGKNKVSTLKGNTEIKEAAKAQAKENVEESKNVDEVKGEQVEGEEKDHLLSSDIATNDPNAPETQEKLKDILKSGGFKFSEKERKVLSGILNK